jgi:speckle-type POZ protein
MASEILANANPSYMRIRRSNFQFEVDYYKSRDLPVGKCITSPTFAAGGYDWALDYYPQGDTLEENGSHVSLYICLKSKVKDITAEYSLEVLDNKGKVITVCPHEVHNLSYSECWGDPKFSSRDTIEKFYIVNGVFVISCNIRVFTEPKAVQTYPGGLRQHICNLWEKGQRCDVTFDVEGQSISAHRLILAARSPVFEAELFGSMAEAKMASIKIKEMRAEVFHALLHFIYTDQLAEDGSGDHQTLSVELLQGLLVAANRYSLDKLSLLCDEQLASGFSVDTVATTLLLADRHNRSELKRKSLDFASDPENFSLVALTDGYLQIMQGASTLFAELSEKVKGSSPFVNKFEKKQRTY